ncbi:MAG TPA: hypothetical protein VHX36_02660 [Candidatus Acidoferrales bacterium]|jgi:hypothetical protein|nr:hypothetical protein [Candidatus Acidoferrales bacterium]
MDRRKMLALLGVSPALAVPESSYARPARPGVSEAAGCATGALVTAMNPAVTAQLAQRIPLAPRLDSLDGKTIYLVDTDWGGMGQNDGIIQEMQAWFAERMPSVKTVIRVKKGNFVTDDPALWKEIADSKGDGVVLGVAG